MLTQCYCSSSPCHPPPPLLSSSPCLLSFFVQSFSNIFSVLQMIRGKDDGKGEDGNLTEAPQAVVSCNTLAPLAVFNLSPPPSCCQGGRGGRGGGVQAVTPPSPSHAWIQSLRSGEVQTQGRCATPPCSPSMRAPPLIEGGQVHTLLVPPPQRTLYSRLT